MTTLEEIQKRIERAREEEKNHSNKLNEIIRTSTLGLIAASWIVITDSRTNSLSRGFKNSLYICLSFFVIVLVIDALQYLAGFLDASNHRKALIKNKQSQNFSYKKEFSWWLKIGLYCFYLKIVICFMSVLFFLINFFNFIHKVG